MALAVSTPVRIFFVVARPLIWLLQHSTELVLRVFGLQAPGAAGAVHSEAELKMLVSESTERGEIEAGEQEMIYKVFDFADKEVADVMVPRPEVVACRSTCRRRRRSRRCSSRRTRAIRSTAGRSTRSSACCTCAT